MPFFIICKLMELHRLIAGHGSLVVGAFSILKLHRYTTLPYRVISSRTPVQINARSERKEIGGTRPETKDVE